MQHRRDVLASLGIALSTALAGCSEDTDGETDGESSDEATETDRTQSSGPELAASAQLNVYRARLFDAVALGRAGQTAAGASVAQSIFQRFENATGEYGAHETLERTSESAYEGFESALGELRSTLEDGDTDAAAEAATTASDQLQIAQQALIGNDATRALDALLLGSRAANTRVLGEAGHFEAAATVATETTERFEDTLVHGALESADGDAYEDFESGLASIQRAASEGDAEGVTDAVAAAQSAAVAGAYALGTESVAGTGHLAAMQSVGYDAAALAGLGGPSEALAHATTLTTYRARIRDAAWLADADEGSTAGTVVGNVFADFEGARAHEALEEADHEAYEGFESGLESLQSAVESGEGVDDALATVDEHLRTGVATLAGDHAPVLQAGFFRARLADARERYERGAPSVAASITQELFERFEADELGFHETLEEASEDLYHRFEEEHLAGLIEAYENDDSEAVTTHHEGALDALLEFEATTGDSVASAAETAYFVARGFDSATVATLGDSERAATIPRAAFEHFESGAAGYHEALEHADHETYETFESDLGAIRSTAESGGDVRSAVQTFVSTAIDGIYAIVGAAGGSNGAAAAAIVQDVYATFEEARVHEALEEADHEAYEGFEAALEAYAGGLDGEGDVPVGRLADATLRAQFAVAGALDDAPVGQDGEGSAETEETESSLEGGPNVVDGVPDDADHVVSMQAVAFEPAELTVSVGDTVAFEHVAGEAHNVVAREEELPADASYWASGDFDSETAAVEGWDNGQGAVQSGQSYVHTFETAGEHPYYCVPHEMAGMEGTIVVEE
ncbi:MULTISPECIES: DUF5059 domain-containing protein [Halomicrobium]|uniref:Blue (Type 1) copper domain protein n=2 Tax=Halomicrobium mukohataei TaxID=57705 RepID=C7P2J0_HALMD|nr:MULTISPECIES: DUF5059 domain-containing protein [Halomicrobium]ACV49305.1 blue (type 1) copper domain protein [Halomicrobium mukohataei DSM 12286]QCD64704.1 DUF5059 domain-containing protein [Halomicrobium mukohataei]QFR19511.1 DUF5059 domain-containing protein [Halomicrobium sp. ZPS1]